LLPLFIGITLLLWPADTAKLKEQRIKAVQENVKKEIQELEDEGRYLLNAIKEENINFSLIQYPQNYPFFIYKNGMLVYWNNYHVVPDYRFVTGDYNYRFLRIPGGQYIGRRWQYGEYELVGLLPLFKDSRISNQYISPKYNEKVFPFRPEKLTEPTVDSEKKICYKDQCLFQISFQDATMLSQVTVQERWGGILLTLAYLIGLFFLLAFRNTIYRKTGLVAGLFIIAALIILPRVSMLFINFPRKYLDFPLFDTTAFASSWLNPTLGDMLLNVIILLVLAILLFIHRFLFIRFFDRAKGKALWISFLVLVYFIAGILLYLIIQTIYHNSQINLDISHSLNFDWLRIASFLLLLIATVIMFLTGHVAVVATERIKLKKYIKLSVFGAPLLVMLIISLLENQNLLIPLIIAAAIVIITTLTNLYLSLKKIRFATYLYVFSWAVAAALIIGYSIKKLEGEQEFKDQLRFAEKFLIENDALAEFLLHDLNKKIEDDLFIQNRLSSPYLGKEVVKDKIRQVYMSGYFDRYDIKIHLFDAIGRPYNPQNFMLRPSDIRANNQKYQTEHKDIYYIDDQNDELAGRYLDLIEIKKRGLRVGYILLDLRLKKIIPENVYPELLVDRRFLQPFQNKNYSYALFRDGEVGFSSGKFNYENDFPVELLKEDVIFDEGITVEAYQHRAVADQEGNIYVISVPAHTFEHFFANFSFFFLLVVFVVMVISLIYAISFVVRGIDLYYSARIQLYLSLAFFIPMLIVTVITLTLVSRSFKEEVNREYEKKAENMARNIANEIVNAPYENQLITLLLKASRYANADVNIFSPSGRLLVTSQPMIYENYLLSPYINPLALVNIVYKNEKIFTANEEVGALDFNSTYYGIKSPETGQLMGILSVPYFQSEAAHQRNEINIFTNIISIFTIIFLLFLLISYLASEYLTFPLKIITRKLQKTSLEFNEPLSWETKDEIGLMVAEYNRMVKNLEESKKALARTEKESAWREMAQQVAHEIKNPLTPMKLTLQHLQRILGKEDGKNEQLNRSVNTLLHQVDTLSDIAGSFSAFARMPPPSRERFDLQKLIQRTISLFTNTEGIVLTFSGVDKELIVEADEQLMGRIFSNIIINAIEAGEGYNPLKIHIQVELKLENRVQVAIADNGAGIEESVREKIFMPHFSTKKTGSGIGLAIARRGVEHAGGKIWFETEEGKGTTFFILLPLVRG
jgi:two-component system nitrogen regulation sensor histidine kinase NtrY